MSQMTGLQRPTLTAPLAILDNAKWDTPGGKEQLARDLTDAVRDMGFWVVTNPGIPQEAMDRQFALANTFFSLPEEEKNEVTFVAGVCHGYRLPGLVYNTPQKQNLEMVNLHKFTPGTNIPRHSFIKRYEEITAFQKLAFDAVITKIFILFAIILELPENHFTDMHKFEKESDDHIRFIKYKPRTLEEDKAVDNQWMAGHTDFGSLTLLFPQPIAADTSRAQYTALWRPPPDQAHLERLGMFFFVRPTNDVIIKPSISPVLKREGLWTKEDDEFPVEDAATCGEFVIARMQNFGLSRTSEAKENEVVRVKKWEVLNKY
ncbi:hypothetical protein B0H14DRAFT_3574605 [Mycena olivaceomarginata]|nr:hypothetical protein B0H14DRAFT_3574605 [Mycena olivaceomarginata]